MSSSFADLGVPAEAVRSLRARGITSAFPIQALAIPPGLAGKDICGRAPTGSGKTIAFGIAVASRVGRGRPGSPRALILAPTRELAGQIETEMAHLMGVDRRRRVAAFYGGVGFGAQLSALRRGVDVAVACPGRLKDLIARGALTLAEVSVVVIDEADRMADMGFLPDVKAILDQVRPDRQTLLFSATLDGDVDTLIRRYQTSPVRVSVEDDDETSLSTTHSWVDTSREDRVSLAVSLISSHGPTIVFCRTKHGAERVAKQLVSGGVKAVALHGGRTQSQRERALEAFSSRRAQALVATDVAARGIHVDGVGCVVHFDPPASPKDYLHRSGRTGRAGAKGTVISFVTPADLSQIKVLQKAIGQPLSPQRGSQASTKAGPGPKVKTTSGGERAGSTRAGHAKSTPPDWQSRSRGGKQARRGGAEAAVAPSPEPAADRSPSRGRSSRRRRRAA
ncbi:MAG TPA: DEAD/DEAH box helicase [Acidimicrobiales bacterium]|nr:DEAD/DEAH box helicase [Acidimicrobiales bacterium]